MRNANETKSFSSSSSSPLDCEVGLALKMQLPPYSCDGGAGGSVGHPHIYDLALLQRSLDNSAASRAYGGMMPVCFTSSQLQELERQKMIHRYITASIPVPPQLLLSSTSTTAPPSLLSQCNTSSGSLELRYPTNGSDPEPWRCKRTDGKKWRCSRDVAPEQKYCERHAHKNRPRSRKHVETSPHSFSPRSTSSQFPYDQTRCIEWLMRGGNGSKQQVVMDNHNNNVYHPRFADGSKIDTAQTTRLFIDAISSKGGEEEKQWPSSALSLGGADEKGNQWLNPISWMNSGGPLGEALCLGNASTIRGGGGSNLTSPRSYGYSNSNTNSSSEDGSHALNFIG